jgi:acetyl-CoA carboxylase biotin carboxyl carrier protein
MISLVDDPVRGSSHRRNIAICEQQIRRIYCLLRKPPETHQVSSNAARPEECIRELAKLLDETGLAEIDFVRDGARLRVAREPQPAPEPVAARPQAPPGPASHPGLVSSPMVGRARLVAKPGARRYVEIGSRVRTGDTLLVIETLRTLDRITAPRSGTVIQILAEDGQPVEFGEPLMIIE